MFRKRKSGERSGAVTVEVALTAPILFLFVFASLEFARVNMISDTCENAAFEGARRGIVPGATAADCTNEVQQILDIVGISDSNITVTPTVITEETPTVTVSVDIPLNAANGYVAPKYFLGDTLTKSITLNRELQ